MNYRLAVLLSLCGHLAAYIVSIGREPECSFMQCQNAGNLNSKTCTCECKGPFYGYLCEKEKRQSSWPNIEFALPESMFGCPEIEGKGWSYGFVNMSLPEDYEKQIWNDDDFSTEEKLMLGPYYFRSFQMNFCVKTLMNTSANSTLASETNENSFDRGNYCVYQAGKSCPAGFRYGNITITGYTIKQTDVGGTLPDVNIGNDSSILINFCCRDDGPTDAPLHLPDNYPFFLFKGPSASECQEVQGMTVSSSVFYMNNQYSDWKFEGFYPLLDNSTHDRLLGIPYCYYEPFKRRECYYRIDGGKSYNGHMNTTATGKPCLIWTNVSSFYEDYRDWYGEFELNYCRSYAESSLGVVKPACLVDKDFTEEFCDIKPCPVDGPDIVEYGMRKPYYSVQHVSFDLPGYAVDGLLEYGKAFASYRPMQKPWFQVDLQEHIEVHAIIVYRHKIWFPVSARYVGTYVSVNQWDFLNYGAYRCDDRRNLRKARVFRFQCKRPIVGQYVSIRNFDHTDPTRIDGKFHYFSIQEIVIVGKSTKCGRPLGMISGNINDYQMQASSASDNELPKRLPFKARVLQPGVGWCSHQTDTNPWFMIDLIVPTKVQGILLQGWLNGQETLFVDTFTLMYGTKAGNLKEYEDPIGTIKVFHIDHDLSPLTVQRFMLTNEILTRFVKIVPTARDGAVACLKTEIIGCQKQLSRDIRCKNGSVDFGFEEMLYHSFWLKADTSFPSVLNNVNSSDKCQEYCLERHCTSYSMTYYSDDEVCVIHNGHRYQPEFAGSWVPDVTILNIVGQRLCFKEYEEIDACNKVLLLDSEEEIKLESPGAPFSYGQGINCTWEIRAKEQKFIQLEFIFISLAETISSAMLKQNGIFDYNPGLCEDKLTIYNSEEETFITFKNQEKYKGSILISTSNKLFVRLESCFQSSKQEMTYFEAKASTIDNPGCGMDSSGCIDTCKQQSAYIATDKYPAKYETGDSCVWKIEGDFGQYVELDIIIIDVLDDDSLCSKSYVAVYDVDLSGRETLIGRFCKQNRMYDVIVSSWHKMRVEFRAGNDKTGLGFLGKYKLVTFIQNYENIISQECDHGWYHYSGSCYAFYHNENSSDDSLTWLEAERNCRNKDGHLVSIGTKDEMLFVHYLLTTVWDTKGNADVYIGLQKKISRDGMTEYRWSDGSPLTYTAWYSYVTMYRSSETGMTQPNGLDNELCTRISLFSIHTMDDWHDTACAYDKIFNYICERTFFVTQTENIFEGLESLSSDFTNTSQLYKCNNSEFISKTSVCDSQIDCVDGSDEDFCGSTCTSSQYQCEDGTCISINSYCDFFPHCPDSSDELLCQWPNCSATEWQCDNKQCIPANKHCDLVHDCFDHSDELQCETCMGSNFQCYDQTCISKSLVCDGYVDCSGFFAEDEDQDCQKTSQKSCAEWWALGKRENGQYPINMGREDIAPSLVECVFTYKGDILQINTVVHHNQEGTMTAMVREVSEVLKYDAHATHIELLKESHDCTQFIRLRCHYIHWQQDVIWVANNNKRFHTSGGPQTPNCSCPFVNRCVPGEDFCKCNSTYTSWYTADINEEWEDSGVITDKELLPVKEVYIGNPGSFIRYLKLEIGPLVCVEGVRLFSDVFLCRSGRTIQSSEKCLLDFDEYGQVLGCRDFSHLDDCEDFACPSNYVKCNKSFCLATRLICDGVSHCRYGEDELDCKNKKCPGHYRCKDSDICIETDRVCDGFVNCPRHDDEILCDISCPEFCKCDGLVMACENTDNMNSSLIPRTVRKLDLSSLNYSESVISLDRFSFLAELNLSRCNIVTLKPYIFKHLKNLLHLDLSFNILSGLAAYTFDGLQNLRTLNLEGNYLLEWIDPNAFIGLSQIPNLEISGTKLKSLNEGTFIGLDSIENLNLSFNAISSLMDKAFVNLTYLQVLDIRSNNIQIFSKDVFYGLHSLKELYSDSYMFCCLKPQSVTVKNCFPQQDEFSSCDDLMRNNVLRWFLWIIGISALIGNLGVLFYKFVFDRSTLRRSHGILITNLGVSDLLMGVYLLIIASADLHYRGKYIWNDIAWRNGALCTFAGILATLSSETSVLTLSLITLDRVIAIKFPFGQFRLTRKKCIGFCISVWLMTSLISLVPLIPCEYFQGKFYARSAVCLALPLTRDKPAGWQYGMSIFVIFNFLLFLVIAFGQYMIYREVSFASTDTKIRSQRKNRDMDIARGLILVVVTDFICWFPIGVMGLMALFDYVIPGEVYAWTAVFILPINSALNPFLYTFNNIIKKRGLMKLGSSKMQRRKSSCTVSTVDQAWTDICNQDLFILGIRTELKYSLADYLELNIMSIVEMLLVICKMAESVVFLHERGLIHGSINEKNISLKMKDGTIDGLSSRVSPKVAEEEGAMAEDIQALGQLALKLLRSRHTKLLRSKSSPR